MKAANVAIGSLIVGALVAGCGGGGGGGGGSTAAGVTTAISPVSSGLNLPSLDPAGYTWQTNFYGPNGTAGGTVTRLATAPLSTATVITTAPLGRVDSVNNGVTSGEAALIYDINTIAPIRTATYATTSNEAAPGGGDVYVRDSNGRWGIALDTLGSDAVVVAHESVAGVRTDVYAFSGGIGRSCTVSMIANSNGQFVNDIAVIGSYIPTNAVSYRGEVYVAVADNGAGGGSARVLRGTGAVWREILSLGGGGRVRVTGMAVVNTYSLILSTANFNVGSGLPGGGAVFHFDGERLQQLYSGDAPLGMVIQDNTIYIGTAGGRLLHLENGQWVSEVGLPTGILSIGALHAPTQAELMVGVKTANGAAVYRRIANSGGVAIPTPPSPVTPTTPPPPTTPAPPAPGSYLASVRPLMMDCNSCHRVGGAAGGSQFVLSNNLSLDNQDYAEVMSFTNVGTPTASLILTKPTNQVGHGGGTRFLATDPAYATIRNWIQNGRPLR